MKYILLLSTLTFLSLTAENFPIPAPLPNPMQKNISFSKLMAFDHVYIVFMDTKDNSEMQIKHDPSCPCKKIKEEHLAQIINELLKLQNWKKV